MPLYDYRCQDCEAVFTELVKYEDRDVQPCPHCGGTGDYKVLKVASLDVLHMGCDPAFPSAYDKWAKIQRAKNSKDGGQWDSNNNRYGGDHEK